MSSILTRRSLLLAVAGGVVAGCARSPAGRVVIAAGEVGGFYVEFADLLARQLRTGGLAADVTPTGGSVENLGMLAAGSATVGLSLSDVGVAAERGESPFSAPMALRALGRVYENYVQLVVRAEDPITTIAELAGRSVSLGATGSGAAVFGDRLLAASGIGTDVTRRPLLDAVDALESRRVDALLWSGGVPTPALAALATRRPIRLLPLSGSLPALRSRHGASYHVVVVPGGAYGSAAAVSTIGVANLLLCTPSLADDLAYEVVSTLVTRAPELVPAAALGTQYLDQRSLIDTGEVQLHAGAAAAYRDLYG